MNAQGQGEMSAQGSFLGQVARKQGGMRASNNVINQPDLADTATTRHPTREHTGFSSAHGTSPKIDHISLPRDLRRHFQEIGNEKRLFSSFFKQALHQQQTRQKNLQKKQKTKKKNKKARKGNWKYAVQ